MDEIIVDAPWVITEEFINKHKIDYVSHDALPYSDASGQAADVYDFVSPLEVWDHTYQRYRSLGHGFTAMHT